MNALGMARLGSRFRGAQPYADDEISRRTFFGRDTAVANLANRVLANRLVVVYARSGVGKSSLLNAGLMPRLREAGYQPLPVRVNDIRRGPRESLLDGVRAEAARQGVEFVDGDPRSLWNYFKTVEFWRDDLLLTPVLLIDQFEELFTLQGQDARESFLRELGELVRGVPGTRGDGPLDNAPPPLHVVISLREDYLGLLEEAADRIPQILAQRFRLLPMTADEALLAITGPAAVDDPLFTTRAFRFAPELEKFLLGYLSQRAAAGAGVARGRVEPFQLQLVCQRIEQLVADLDEVSIRARGISLDDVGGERALERTLAEFYGRAIRSLKDRRLQRRARRLCERHLISADGRRLSLEEGEVERLTGLSAEQLRTLVDSRLLRVDRRTDSSYYELSHDTLVAPILSTFRASGLLLGWGSMSLGIILAAATVVGVGWIIKELFNRALTDREFAVLILATGLGGYLANRALDYGSRSLNLFGGMTTFKSVWGRALAVVAVSAGAILTGASLGNLINPAAIIAIFGLLLGFACLAFPTTVLRRGLKTLVSDDPPVATDCLRIEQTFRQLGRASTIATSAIAALGTVLMLAHVQDPERLGPSVAWVLNSLIMGIFAKLMIARPIELTAARLRRNAEQAPPRSQPAPLPAPTAPSMRRIVGSVLLMIVAIVLALVLAGGSLAILLEPLPILLGVLALLGWLERQRSAAQTRSISETCAHLAQAALPAGVLAMTPALLSVAGPIASMQIDTSITALFRAATGMVLGILLHLILSGIAIAYGDVPDQGRRR